MKQTRNVVCSCNIAKYFLKHTCCASINQTFKIISCDFSVTRLYVSTILFRPHLKEDLLSAKKYINILKAMTIVP